MEARTVRGHIRCSAAGRANMGATCSRYTARTGRRHYRREPNTIQDELVLFDDEDADPSLIAQRDEEGILMQIQTPDGPTAVIELARHDVKRLAKWLRKNSKEI